MIKDLIAFIYPLSACSHDLIVCIYTNGPFIPGKCGTAKIVELMDLVDSLINKFGKEDEPPTHRRGSHRRIDLLFCTPSIKKSYFVLASYQSMKFFLRIIGDRS